ncbi:MAG: glycosyltransferase, partial [Elusimicrobia bacterium]|nr:glycosyltransferase [Elusimicrobiota bacterium]
MNKNFKLTILMPCYNREPYMREALDSIFAQVTNFNYKLIIIDDASTDNSLQIAKEYKQKYPDNIELIENEKNLKLSKTIYKGYALLKTD